METELQDGGLAVYPRTKVLFQPTDRTHPNVLSDVEQKAETRVTKCPSASAANGYLRIRMTDYAMIRGTFSL